MDTIRKSGARNRLPFWFRQDIPDESILAQLNLLSEFGVHTVCQEAKCPNLSFCFKNHELTFMILGDTCTRNCRFCAVKKSQQEKLFLDSNEPYRIAKVVEKLNLNYVVITSVTRDDLSDGGAEIFAQTIEAIHNINPAIKIEVLIPDFKGSVLSLKSVLDAQPDVIGHNTETVQRLYPDLRPQADYGLSLFILHKIKEIKPDLLTKSSLMLGLGETEEEVINTMEDLRYNQCDIFTLGQYLAPSPQHYPVKEFISFEQFVKYRKIGLDLGFQSVLSGPLVRSSYQAEELYREISYVSYV